MTNFEGESVEDERRKYDAVEIRDDNHMFQNCSVSIKNLDENIDSAINRTYAYEPGSLYKQCSSNFDKYFANTITLRR